MGCGESKHAVATADTISKSKRSNSTKGGDIIEPAVDNATNPSVVAESQENGYLSGDSKDSIVVKEVENVNITSENNNNVKETIKPEEKKNDDHIVEASSEVENVKVIEENVQSLVVENKELEVKENVVPVQEEESHNFLSPNKDVGIESIISDGLSGKSEYHSPRASHVEPEDLAKENDVVDVKSLAEETETEAKNEETVNVNEEKVSVISEEEEASATKEVTTEEALTTEEITPEEGSTAEEVPVVEALTAEEVPVVEALTAEEASTAKEVTTEETSTEKEVTTEDASTEKAGTIKEASTEKEEIIA